ncbi:hypothetical protein K435DRAFT_789975 [Dendrothele bispora CBS 962.96]|uniref:Uncharacterized protein n=1 Tax=Dendrothele bispora (strain CBS 962.96) TaxID=1314807 RepID=A0A4V6T5P8_DENBC|nr:hypothetical protein K435DRAFT_789975 [Dendrothele bispora CBS 962.96]
MNSPLTPRNVSKRVIRSENTPPLKATRLTGASVRRKARTSHGMRNAYYDAEKARIKSRQRPIRYVIQTVTPPDVEMQDAQPVIRTTPVNLPRALGRPEPTEASADSIKAAFGSDYAGQTAEFVRDMLKDENRGYRLLRTNASVKVEALRTLPTELSIVVNDPTATNLPTHMLAIYGRPSPTKKTQVKLFPVHAMVMAAHCARLPPFASSPNVDSVVSPSPVPHETTVPVRPICLPHPQSFSALLQFLHTCRPEVLYKVFLPTMPSEEYIEDPLNPEHIMALANQLGRTFVVNVFL